MTTMTIMMTTTTNKKLWCTILICLMNAFVYAQSINMSEEKFQVRGEICHWDYNKKAAVVLTFDDWTPGQYPLVVPTLKQFKMVATFFPLTSNIEKTDIGWKAAQATAKNGNELGNHTLTHPDITKLTDETLEKEVMEPVSQIEKIVPNNAVISFAYPYGAGADDQHSIEFLRSKGFVGARSVWGMSDYSYNFAKEDEDYYKIHCYGMNESTKNSQFNAEVESVIKGGGLLTFLYHSVDDDLNSYHDSWYAQVKLDSLKEQLRFLKKHQDEVWVTTFGNAILYHREANCAKLRVQERDGFIEAKLTITNLEFRDLVPQTLMVPLTIKIYTDKKWSSVEQNGMSIPIDKQTDTYVQFRAIPNGGEIVLKQN